MTARHAPVSLANSRPQFHAGRRDGRRRKALITRSSLFPAGTAWLSSIEQAVLRSALQRLAPTSFGARIGKLHGAENKLSLPKARDQTQLAWILRLIKPLGGRSDPSATLWMPRYLPWAIGSGASEFPAPRGHARLVECVWVLRPDAGDPKSVHRIFPDGASDIVVSVLRMALWCRELYRPRPIATDFCKLRRLRAPIGPLGRNERPAAIR